MLGVDNLNDLCPWIGPYKGETIGKFNFMSRIWFYSVLGNKLG